MAGPMSINQERCQTALGRLPVLRTIFILAGAPDKARGYNFHASGITDEAEAKALHRAGLIELYFYRSTDGGRTGRRYRRVTKGELTARFVMILRERFRAHNLGFPTGPDDGLGCVALREQWGERRAEIRNAAWEAYQRWIDENGG